MRSLYLALLVLAAASCACASKLTDRGALRRDSQEQPTRQSLGPFLGRQRSQEVQNSSSTDDLSLAERTQRVARSAAAWLQLGTQNNGSRTEAPEPSLAQRTQRGVRRAAVWLRRRHPVVVLLAATALVQHARARADKRRGGDESQVINVEDFHIAIVTTAALPWMTGTAINPLLRAAYLAKAGKRVTLAVPWLHPSEQPLIFPGKMQFATPEEQERHIRAWLQERGGVKADFKLRFYPARYDLDRGSILPLGDITRVFAEDECDICVLEEPEHLTWYHSGANWRHRFKLVVGVVHTNYKYYAQEYLGPGAAAVRDPFFTQLHILRGCNQTPSPRNHTHASSRRALESTLLDWTLATSCVRSLLPVGDFHGLHVNIPHSQSKHLLSPTQVLSQLNIWMCGAYCDKVIKLSDTIQPLPRAVVCNVHGVRAEFLEIGRRAARPSLPGQRRAGAYFLGKVLWAKGHRLLLDYLALEDKLRLPHTHVDVYGGGEDLEAVRAEVKRTGVDVSFFPATDHSAAQLRQYKVFLNPSRSEVLSTTTAEALAMGKFVVLQRHASNDFFVQFRNTLLYDSPAEFLKQLRFALANEPEPLSPEERRALSWEGATDRFLEAVGNCTLADVLPTLGDHTTSFVHASVQKGGPVGDVLRQLTGAGPVSKQAWLAEERYRSADTVEIVEASVLTCPPGEIPVRTAAPPRRTAAWSPFGSR